AILDRNATVRRRKHAAGFLPNVRPALAAIRCIDRGSRVVARPVDDALVNDRIGLRRARLLRPEDANGTQLARVLRRDLAQVHEALPGVILSPIDPALL